VDKLLVYTIHLTEPHLFHHNFTGAFRYDFLDKVIKKSRISIKKWQDIAVIIKKYQLNNFIFPVFFLLKKYYQTPFFINFLKEIQPVNPLTRKLINKLTKINIFNDEPRLHAGINRFKNLFFLSPSPFWKKILIFFNPQVIFAVFWVFWKRIKNSVDLNSIKFDNFVDL